MTDLTARKLQLKANLIESRDLLDQVLTQVGNHEETTVYQDGLQWTVRELMVHLAEAERGMYNQLSNIAEGREIIPADFDIERFNRRTTEKNPDTSVAQAREMLEQHRAQLLTWLEGIEDDKLDRTGRHASLNIMSVEDIVRLVASHERGHAQDIARAVGMSVP